MPDEIACDEFEAPPPYKIRRHAVIPDAFGVCDAKGAMVCLTMNHDAAEFVAAALLAYSQTHSNGVRTPE